MSMRVARVAQASTVSCGAAARVLLHVIRDVDFYSPIVRMALYFSLLQEPLG